MLTSTCEESTTGAPFQGKCLQFARSDVQCCVQLPCSAVVVATPKSGICMELEEPCLSKGFALYGSPACPEGSTCCVNPSQAPPDETDIQYDVYGAGVASTTMVLGSTPPPFYHMMPKVMGGSGTVASNAAIFGSEPANFGEFLLAMEGYGAAITYAGTLSLGNTKTGCTEIAENIMRLLSNVDPWAMMEVSFLPKMVRESVRAKMHYLCAINIARHASEVLIPRSSAPGSSLTQVIVSKRDMLDGLAYCINRETSQDCCWNTAVGRYTSYVRAIVTRTRGSSNIDTFSMDFSYTVRDVYDVDPDHDDDQSWLVQHRNDIVERLVKWGIFSYFSYQGSADAPPSEYPSAFSWLEGERLTNSILGKPCTQI
jgi:hypothetical protein